MHKEARPRTSIKSLSNFLRRRCTHLTAHRPTKLDVRDAIRQDVFSKVYDFREFVAATSGAADVRRCGEGGTREQDVGRAREAVGRGLGGRRTR
ncbi:hypothetical protein PF010_g19570 [Phytophthora fragariae]|nr:hypothetical protein PF003_g23152 [Phytophthora fragariae]KAE8928930.1 hypothetical protein PF009_g20945 [Phytophthora fragariae]KAE9087872.1 hypothetical protein PF010_g19570 [Phytophthora fragariae]KAE9195984.1 hypothetical protein PF004_g20284 [Phytophthora fragariae]KAE9200665.1 hypothetical protein PF002_g21760 [Phytophthora fragariae]